MAVVFFLWRSRSWDTTVPRVLSYLRSGAKVGTGHDLDCKSVDGTQLSRKWVDPASNLGRGWDLWRDPHRSKELGTQLSLNVSVPRYDHVVDRSVVAIRSQGNGAQWVLLIGCVARKAEGVFSCQLMPFPFCCVHQTTSEGREVERSFAERRRKGLLFEIRLWFSGEKRHLAIEREREEKK